MVEKFITFGHTHSIMHTFRYVHTYVCMQYYACGMYVCVLYIHTYVHTDSQHNYSTNTHESTNWYQSTLHETKEALLGSFFTNRRRTQLTEGKIRTHSKV